MALRLPPATRADCLSRSVRILSMSWANEDVRMLDVNWLRYVDTRLVPSNTMS